MEYVFINNDVVEKIEECECTTAIAHYYQQVIPLSEFTRPVKVGFAYERGEIFQRFNDITPRQLKQALVLSGLPMEAIKEAILTFPEPNRSLAVIQWEHSIAYERRNPMVSMLGSMMGWTEDQLDDLWDFAGSL